MLISKIIVTKLNSCVKMVFYGIQSDVDVQIRSFLSFSNFEFNKSRNYFKALLAYFKDDSKIF